jgi:hypothetical protein
MDFVLEAPFENEKVVQTLARFGGLDEAALLQKYRTYAQAIELQRDFENSKREFTIVSESGNGTDHSFRLNNGKSTDPEMKLMSQLGGADFGQHGPPRSFLPIYEEIRQSSEDLEERVRKYSSFLNNLRLDSSSTLQRQATRSVQNELMSNINVTDMENQDELRREFTRYLFKKNC